VRLVKIKFLDHFASIEEEKSDNFYLTSVGWDCGKEGKYTKICMVLGNELEPHAPFMNIITKDIIKKEYL